MIKFDDIAGCIKSFAEQILLHSVYGIMLGICFDMCTNVNWAVIRLSRQHGMDLDLTTRKCLYLQIT